MKRVVLSSLMLAACSGANENAPDPDEAPTQARRLAGSTQMENRCEADETRNEVSEYDTSGDSYPDVRKVFLRIGTPPMVTLVLVCREADLNADGRRDVVRYYTDEGRPLREEADRNFDGQMDEIVFFEDGRIVRMEQDTNGNGMVDTKVFYEDGRPFRAERDMGGRSTATNWHPDRWEYYENGRMVRMGTDIDGDRHVDRWDRDAIWSAEEEQRRAREEAEAARQEQDATDTGESTGEESGG